MNRILVVAAHPDDEVLGCGATIAKHVQNMDEVQVLFLADGFSSRTDLCASRHQAASQAANFLGCCVPIFLNFPDNQLDAIPLLEIVKKIEATIQDFRPNIIYTHHIGDLNIDHQVSHRATLTACRPQPNFCVKEIYSFEVPSATHWQSFSMGKVFNPNYFIDIANVLARKMQALEYYEDEMHQYPHARSVEAVESLAKFRGSIVGIRQAEAFVVERLLK